MNTNPFKNGEGYADPTAYRAIKQIKEVKKVSEIKVRRGDIVNIQTAKDTRKGFVIQNFGRYVVFLSLLPDRPQENPYCIELADGEIYWTDLARLAYAFMDTILDVYDHADSAVVDKVRKNIANCYGFTSSQGDIQPAVEVEKKPLSKLEGELIKAKERADIFERLYKELLAAGR